MKNNIVYIFSDQQRTDTLGCYGQKLNVTPFIDKLAESGVLFENAFTPQPVCGPARACIQSGKYATEVGCFVNGINLPESINTLAKSLKSAGYSTGYVGKWHLASNIFCNENYETSAVPVERRGGFDEYWCASDVLEFTSDGFKGYVFDKNNNRIEFNKYRVDAITDYAIDFINSYEKEKPFFLFVSYLEPHHQNNHNTFESPDELKRFFEYFEVPKDLQGLQGNYMEEYANYLACCRAIDDNVKRINDVLLKNGLLKETTIIYTSDHGCHFKTLNSEYKRTSFENTIKVPLIIKGERFKGGRKVKGKVDLLDVTATVLDIANAKMKVSGKSFLRKKNPNKDIFIQISESEIARVLRTDRYKLVINAEGDAYKFPNSTNYKVKYLFDLWNDELERKNLASDQNYAEVLKKLKNKIIKKIKKIENLDITIQD